METHMTRKAPWARNKPTVKRTRRPVKRVSAARAKQRREYEQMKAKFLESHSYCSVCHTWIPKQMRELHHWAGRVGRLLSWEPGFRMVCGNCHYDIHSMPSVARSGDHLCPIGLWNDFARAQEHFHRQNSTE